MYDRVIYLNARGYLETWKHTWEIECNKDQFEIFVTFVCRKYIYFLSVLFVERTHQNCLKDFKRFSNLLPSHYRFSHCHRFTDLTFLLSLAIAYNFKIERNKVRAQKKKKKQKTR